MGDEVRSKFSPFRIRGRKRKLEQRSGLLAVADEVELAGDAVCRQRAAISVQKKDKLHKHRRGEGLLGAQVEHGHDVPLVAAPHKDPHPRREGPRQRRSILQRKRAPNIRQCASPCLKAQGHSSRVIWMRSVFPSPFFPRHRRSNALGHVSDAIWGVLQNPEKKGLVAIQEVARAAVKQ